MQIRATDGLVNYYLPGYVKQGLGSIAGARRRVRQSQVQRHQRSDDRRFVIVRPEVITALGAAGARRLESWMSRANACRAVGILRGRAALPDSDGSAAHQRQQRHVRVADRDPEDSRSRRRVRRSPICCAISTTGCRRRPSRRRACCAAQTRCPRCAPLSAIRATAKRNAAALAALAMMPEAPDRDLFLRYLGSKDEKLRAAAAEGLGRIGNPADEPAARKVMARRGEDAPRLAAAFGAGDGRQAGSGRKKARSAI